MGIQGLLSVLKPVITTAHINDLRGKKVAVDAYAWLHKSVYSCCEEICRNNENNTVTDGIWINYCLSLVDMLLFHDMKVTLVFDGDNLPAKKETEKDRLNNRNENIKKAKEFSSKGDAKTAHSYYSRAVDITPTLAAHFIRVIKNQRPQVVCIVAPYEADAQLSYLSTNGIVDVIISEDSDTIPYGCRF